MSSAAQYFSSLTVADYAALAFGADPAKPGAHEPKFEGGVFAGKGTPWERKLERDTAATARLVPVAPGKVFVRWCDSALLAKVQAASESPPWSPAAYGPWWSSDAMADMIVERTIKTRGPYGDTAPVVREYSAVKYEWSDLGGVIVCRTTHPILALIGVGRPVITTPPSGGPSVTLDSRQLQYVILTSWPRGTFRAHEFFQPLFLGTSRAFTTWWRAQNLTQTRRAAVRAAHRP